jgi:hypothetical protein
MMFRGGRFLEARPPSNYLHSVWQSPRSSPDSRKLSPRPDHHAALGRQSRLYHAGVEDEVISGYLQIEPEGLARLLDLAAESCMARYSILE